MIDASPSQATLAASLSDLLVNHQHASVICLPRHYIPSFFSTSAMSFCFLYIKDVYLSSSKVNSVAHPSPFLIGTDTRSIALRISPCSFALLSIISLRSIPFIRFAQSSLLQPKGSGSPLPCPSVMCHILSSTVAKGYCATFHYVIIPEFLYDSASHGEVLHYHFITFHFISIRFG